MVGNLVLVMMGLLAAGEDSSAEPVAMVRRNGVLTHDEGPVARDADLRCRMVSRCVQVVRIRLPCKQGADEGLWLDADRGFVHARPVVTTNSGCG